MDISAANILLSAGAGLASVLSPCVLPVVPVIAAGGAERRDWFRPLLVVLGLTITFMAMGAVSALFGAYLIGKTRLFEQAGGAVIVILGLMVVFDVSIFKRFYRLSNIQVRAEGRFSGLLLGMALGIVWVPCIGPMLSSILTMVGTTGEMSRGMLLLGFYSLGLSLPLLAVAYSSQALQRRLTALARYDAVIRSVTGSVLVLFGLYIVVVGNFAF